MESYVLILISCQLEVIYLYLEDEGCSFKASYYKHSHIALVRVMSVNNNGSLIQRDAKSGLYQNVHICNLVYTVMPPFSTKQLLIVYRIWQ